MGAHSWMIQRFSVELLVFTGAADAPESRENHMRNTIYRNMLAAGVLALSVSAPAVALDDETADAAIGGGLGGAAGAAIGNEVGGRTGAILGGAAGAAGGAAITTDGDSDHDRHGHRGRDHCPPGQAKKGRC